MARILSAAVFLVAAALLCPAQVEFIFVEQNPSRIPGVLEYHVWARNGATQPVDVLSAQVIAVAQQRTPPFHVLTPVNLKRVIDLANQRSIPHVASVATEYIGSATSIVEVAGGLKIKEKKYAVLIPAGTAGLTLIRGIVEREWRRVEWPDDQMPVPRFRVPANDSIEFTIWGTE